MVMDKFRKFFILFFKAAMSECGPDGFSSSKVVKHSTLEKKPVVTHDKTRWDYDPWIENK